MRWFRFYVDTLHSRTVQNLPARLFRAWVNLLCLAASAEGVLPDPADVAFALRTTEAHARKVLAELTARGLLEQTADGLAPKDWAMHQRLSDDVSLRVRQHRAKHKPISDEGPARGRDVTLHVTLPKRYGNGLDIEEKREEKEHPPKPPSGDDYSVDVTPAQVVEAWNDICPPLLPRVIALTQQRRRKILARIEASAERRRLDWWRKHFARIRDTPFLCGDNTQHWRADFDWAVRSEETIVRVWEGRYDARADPAPGRDGALKLLE